MTWKLALHTWTIDTTPLGAALEATGRSGFDAVEIRRSDVAALRATGSSIEDVAELIRASGVTPGIIGTEYGWFFTTGAEQKRLFDVLRETCELARRIGCTMIMSAPGQVVGHVSDAIAATRIAGEIVGEYGMRLALEFNSQHDVVNRTEVLREIIDGAGNPQCGMLLDAYHLHRGPGIAEGLAGVTREELFVVQYSDVPPTPSVGVRRPIDRLPPGDGMIDWADFFERLSGIGYEGYLSYEAPNPMLWDRPPLDVAIEGVRKTRALLEQHARSIA